MTLQEFLEIQQSGCDYLLSQMDVVEKGGIIRDPALDGQMCGYFVNFVHSQNVRAHAVEFARQLSEFVDSDPYGHGDIHSTIASMRIPALPRVDPVESDEHRVQLNGIVRAVRKSFSRNSGPIQVKFNQFLYNQVAVLAMGTPSLSFVDSLNAIIELAKKECGVELAPPRGATITLGRFTRDIPPEKLASFFELIKTFKPLGMSKPCAIRVQYNNYPGVWNCHEINTYATIPLNYA
jgi:hypothetical protein